MKMSGGFPRKKKRRTSGDIPEMISGGYFRQVV